MNAGQKQIKQWFEQKSWSYWTPHEILARVVEEVGELARLINHQHGPKKKKSQEATQHIEDEVGDILYALACLANTHNIDLDQALQKSIDKVELRDKDRFN